MPSSRKRIGIAVATAAILTVLLGGCAPEVEAPPVSSQSVPTDLCTEECTEFTLSVIGDGGDGLHTSYSFNLGSGVKLGEGTATNVGVPWVQKIPLKTSQLPVDGTFTLMSFANNSEGITCQISVDDVLITEVRSQKKENTDQALCVFLMSSLTLNE